MMRRAAAVLITTLFLFVDLAAAQTYPNRPIRIITSEVGGGNDLVARLIAPRLTEALGQGVIVENRGSVVYAELVSKSPPDGHTLLLGGGATIWLTPFLKDNVLYDPVRDLAPITLTHRSPNILVVHPSLPVRSTKELIALAKARPGELNYASGATGAQAHLAAELLKSMAGINIVAIPYRGGGPAINALIGGQVQLMFATAGSVAAHIRIGRLRGVAVTSAQPSPLIPDFPTVAASVPGYECISITALFAQGNTPVAIINRLNQEMVRILGSPDVKGKLFSSGVESVSSTPEELAATIKTDMARMGKVIRDAGIKAE